MRNLNKYHSYMETTQTDGPITPAIIDEDVAKQTELTRMKGIATALLVVSFIIFLIATIYKDVAVWVGYVQAAAEAAMVGAIADWFAVTALFRHPLGLKIPHTAIIPRRKDFIGDRLGLFVKNNFLSRAVISAKIRSMNVTENVAAWLVKSDNSAQIAHQVAVALATVVEVIKDEDVQDLIEHSLIARLETLPIAPLLGNVLSLITSGGRERDLVQGTVQLGSRILEDNKSAIMAKISQETPWWLPRGVDQSIYQKLVTSLEGTIQAIKDDPDHPLYSHFNDMVLQFVDDLKNSSDIAAKETAWKEELLREPVVKDFAASLWLDMKQGVTALGEGPQPDIRESIQQGLMRLGETMENDPALQEKINRWIENSAAYLIEQYGHEVEYLIANTIHNWDAEATSHKIELQVGKDLQYIRINGTLVGGLVGLIIHGISHLIS